METNQSTEAPIWDESVSLVIVGTAMVVGHRAKAIGNAQVTLQAAAEFLILSGAA